MNDDKVNLYGEERIPLGAGSGEPPVDPSTGGGVIGSPGVVGGFGKADTGNIPITSSQDISLNFGGYELINPWFFNQTPMAQSLRCKPNGFKNTRGEMAGHGSVLMTKKNVDLLMADIAADSNHLTTFTISDGDETVTYERLQVYNIVSISGSITPTDEEVFLVEFEDIRRSLNRIPIDIQANLTHFRSGMPSYSEGLTTDYYYYPSLTIGITDRIIENQVWTFDDIIEFCFYRAEQLLPFISSQDIPTPLFAGKQGFAAQNVYASGSMWQLLCELGKRSMFFFTMNPDGSLNFIDPNDLTDSIIDSLADYEPYLVYNDNNDLYEDYLRVKKFYPIWDTTTVSRLHMMRNIYTVAQTPQQNTEVGEFTTVYKSHQPMPGDSTSPLLQSPAYALFDVGGWDNFCNDWSRDYAQRAQKLWEKNPPFRRSYAKVIDVDMETGVDMVHHDCQGIGPNSEGGMFTHVVNRRIEFNSVVCWQDVEKFRRIYRPPFVIFKALSDFVGSEFGGTIDVEYVTAIGTPYVSYDTSITYQETILSPVGIRTNDYILATYDPLLDLYLVINRSTHQDYSPFIEFTVTAAGAGTISEGEVTNHYGPGRQLGIGTIVSLSNPTSVTGDFGDTGLAFWDQDDGYVIVQGSC